MTFQEKLRINKEVYFLAKKENKSLNREVSSRNNKKHIVVAKYKKKDKVLEK